MPIVQHLLSFARPLAARVRSVRRPFRPSPGEGAYRLPRDVSERLASALAPFRNRDSAFALATFIARYHSNSDRVLGAFAIDRRALADHAALMLSEARVRGAIKVLEAVGFLDRALSTGSTHKATQDGLRRKPIRFAFGADYRSLLVMANKRAQKAKGSDPHARRIIAPISGPRPSRGLLQTSALNSPKHKSEADKTLYLGEITKRGSSVPSSSALNLLEAALERLGRAIGKAHGSQI